MSANALRATHSGHRPKTMHSDVLDERMIEPSTMVIARFWGVGVAPLGTRIILVQSAEHGERSP